jgi:hypothetical protein
MELTQEQLNTVAKDWLRKALAAFTQAEAAQQQLASLLAENGRAGMRAAELADEKATLEHDIETLKKLKKSLNADGTLKSPLTASEWDSLLKDTAMGFGGVREYITRLSDLFGVKSVFRG